MSEHEEPTSKELIAWGKEKGGVSEEMYPWEEDCSECGPRYRLGFLAQRLEEAREAMRESETLLTKFTDTLRTFDHPDNILVIDGRNILRQELQK